MLCDTWFYDAKLRHHYSALILPLPAFLPFSVGHHSPKFHPRWEDFNKSNMLCGSNITMNVVQLTAPTWQLASKGWDLHSCSVHFCSFVELSTLDPRFSVPWFPRYPIFWSKSMLWTLFRVHRQFPVQVQELRIQVQEWVVIIGMLGDNLPFVLISMFSSYSLPFVASFLALTYQLVIIKRFMLWTLTLLSVVDKSLSSNSHLLCQT